MSRIPNNPDHPSKLFSKVSAYYAKTLHEEARAKDYLQSKGITDPALLETFQVGYSNGTLHRVLPSQGPIIEGLTTLGILKEDGSEALRDCIVLPLHNQHGEIISLYGRTITAERNRYLPGNEACIYNHSAARHHTALLFTPSEFDCLRLWQAGFRNAIVLKHADAWGDAHEQLLDENAIEEVFACTDYPGLEQKLGRHGVPLYALQWPDRVEGAVDFFGKGHSEQDLEVLISAARAASDTTPEKETQEESIEDGLAVLIEGRRYEVRGLERPNAGQLKATVKAIHNKRFYVDTLNLYLSRARRSFIAEAAQLFRKPAETIQHDINHLIERLEKSHREGTLNTTTTDEILLTQEEQRDARRLGRSSNLIHQIQTDLEKLHVLGERENKLTAYLVMTSRKTEDPLALQILSGSGAGKSHLQNTVLELCPSEDLVRLTSLSDQALFYKKTDSLKHKVLALEEESGALGASYAIRNLISAKQLAIETTGRNQTTGELQTQRYIVHGPTAVFETTTNPSTHPETKSRFILTSVDETPAQTRLILEAQRQGHTLEGLKSKRKRSAILRRHHAFQRMLKPVTVVNPYEPLLTFKENRLSTRRDQPKYLQLILVVTFLHQMQRTWKHDADIGDYIETTLDDIAIANELAHHLFGQVPEELNGPSRTLLEETIQYVRERAVDENKLPAEVEFIRRDLREHIGWSEYQLRTHLRHLEDLQYLQRIAGRHGKLYRYRLLCETSELQSRKFHAGIKGVEQIQAEAEALGIASTSSTLRASTEHFEAPSSEPLPEALSPANPDEQTDGAAALTSSGLSHVNGSHPA